jgi:hypothetical protein
MVLATIYALLSFTFEGYDLSIYGLLSLVYDTFSSEWFLYIFFGDMGARFLFFYYKIKKFKISLFSSIPFGVGWLYTKYHLKKMKN